MALSEQVVPLALFDPEVDDDTKREMVLNLKSPPKERQSRKRYIVPRKDKVEINSLRNVNLVFFVSIRSKGFFRKLSLDPECLEHDPSEWPGCESFQKELQRVKSLQVVNDTAERAVALTKEYNLVSQRSRFPKFATCS